MKHIQLFEDFVNEAEQPSNEPITASLDPFKAALKWDSTFKRFEFDGGTTASVEVIKLSNTIKNKAQSQLFRLPKTGDVSVLRIDSIKTPPEAQGQGYAQRALDTIVKIADNNNTWLLLTVQPFGNKSVSTYTLVQFYEKAGFKALSLGKTPLMIRKPNPQ